MPVSPRAGHPERPLDLVVGKVFRRLVPLFIVMLICNQLNRSNIGYAQVHLEADVGIGAAAYGLGAGLFFVAYALFELPSNMLLERYGPKVWLPRIMVSWGAVSAAMAFVTNETTFYILRFLLGVAEAGFFPAVIYFFSRWLPGSHRGRATALFVAGSSIAAAISGPVSGPLLAMDGIAGAAGWQWLFGLEGLLSIVVGLIAYRLLDSSIQDARWLRADEKRALAEEIEREDAARRAAAGTASVTVSRWRLLLSGQMLAFCGIYFAIQLSIYANTFWLPTIVRRIEGTDDITVGLLSSLPWICAVAAMYLAGRASDRTGRSKPLLVAALLVAAAGTYAAAVVSPAWALVALCVAAMGFKSASPLFWTIPQGSVHPLAAAAAVAVINSLGNLGGFVAPYGFGLVQEATGQVTYGLYALAACSVLGALLVLGVRGDRTVGGDAVASAPVPPGRPGAPPAGDRGASTPE
ncbi:MFS transporter [Marinitenerispora sediminis]|uniref:MFS transporter n=1 Tax=Marinitenerispora sediminis TaxID=1931232 RepID=A0A368T2U2_9ACTN|nr:MFS transporter [Marinitenerispora sediminis]RCV52115.1 MFS transporter [Marinitenerispora sediminis]RCV55528.1 MFS transporter [Marinitenerispora sediminis]RCV57832.1 MFS transporter [Marinitenerispora sediminis]